MTSLRIRWHVIAIGAIGLLAIGGGVASSWIAATFQMQLNALYAANNGSISNEVADYTEINRISSVNFVLQTLTTPLVFGGLVAVFIALMMLALWWSRQERRDDRFGSIEPDEEPFLSSR